MDSHPRQGADESSCRPPLRLDGTTLGTVGAVVVWLILVWPLASGEETLFFRDVFHTHHPLKAFGAEQLREGRVPATNPTWGLGQAYRGNPNAVALYPGNVLYVLLPFWSAFNLHYALHWLLAGVAMAVLARTLGQGRAAAALAGLTYAGSGFMLAAMTFYNILVVVSWWPLVLAAGCRGGRRAVAAGALACGLALLGGEPVTAALGVPILLALSASRLGLARGLVTTLGIGAGGLLVALPQLVATLRILPGTARGGGGLLRSQASFYSFEPERLLELVVPFPFGVPGVFGPLSPDAVGVLEHLPYFFSFHFGLVALFLAGLATRRRLVLAGIAGSGLVLAWIGGLSGAVLLALSAGLFRTPEKLLFWTALALPLLAGWGLEEVFGRCRSPREPGSGAATRPLARLRGAALAGAAALLLAALLLAVSGAGDGGLAARVLDGAQRAGGARGDAAPETAESWGRLQVRSLLLAAALLALAWLVLRARRPALLVPLQLASLLQLRPLLLSDDVAAYTRPDRWGGVVRSGEAVIHVRGTYPPWEVAASPPTYPPGESYALDTRREARELGAAPGVLHGLSYPAAPDLDGMVHRFHLLALFRLSQGSWEERVAWARVLGVDLLASPEPVTSRDVELVASETSFGSEIFLYRVREPAPQAWWPRRARPAATPRDAFSLVAAAREVDELAVLPGPVAQAPDGTVRVVTWEPDRIELEVESAGGGVVVVRRAFSNLWRARDERGAELPVLPADLTLLGVGVADGGQRVRLEIDQRPELVAVAVAVLGAALLAWAAFGPGVLSGGGPSARRTGRRSGSAAGARS